MNLLTVIEASKLATSYIGKSVTPSNIAYLIQYGLIKKISKNSSTMVSKEELIDYYQSSIESRKNKYKEQFGDDLNWTLSFEQYTETETTKHVHRLHPYKGKFIPQIVEYFLGNHIDKFKTEIYFKPGDIVLDPFSGSGTTIVQACELGIHSVGIDISVFNTLIGDCKITKCDITVLQNEIDRITNALEDYIKNSSIIKFEKELIQKLNIFNNQYFPVPGYKYCLRNRKINEKKYGGEKEKEFLLIYKSHIKKYSMKLLQEKNETFLDKWYLQHIRNEIDFVFEEIQKIQHIHTKKIISLILSRSIRSCRATTHADLNTLLGPITAPYYCRKHGKICKPLFSIMKWWKVYSKDTVNRLQQFDKLRTDTFQIFLTDDSHNIDILTEVKRNNLKFGKLIEKQKIKGIFSSPPYVGLIDYHEQHAYAYSLFGFERKDDLEIGPFSKGQTREAQKRYIRSISDVLNNCKRFLTNDYDVFLVVNDKYNMYPTIAENVEMQIVNHFNRPVLNRSEKDKKAYSETIFHLKKKI